jgi:cardiolipin synthase
MKLKNLSPWIRVGIPTAIITLIGTLTVANVGDQQKDIDYTIRDVSEVTSDSFQRTMENLLGPSFVSGNRITALQNGDEIFPAMLEAIRGAEKTICFESYIYISGEVGQRFVDALSERARAGVKVRLLIDWAGSEKAEDEMIDALKKAGVDVKFFHPIAWYTITRMNNRTHRKLLIVDGKIGFTGGVGIADDWLGNADSPAHWRDSHFKIVGPVVGQLQAAFVDNWITTSPDVLHDDLYFPKIVPDGPSKAQVFKSAPREGSASTQLMYLLAISAARREILLQNAYFVPGKISRKFLLEARSRGVKIRVIVPGPIMDSESTRQASRHYWGELLESGIEIYEYQPTMYHVKAMIVDDALVSVGSTNFDDRSFRLNSEANLNVIDPAFAATLKKAFEDDLKKSRAVSLQEWTNRPKKEKVLGWFASLFSSQL